MPRFRIIATEQQVQKALSFLILVKGFSPQEAADLVLDLFDDIYEWESATYYCCHEVARGEEIFKLKRKYRTLFGADIQIEQE